MTLKGSLKRIFNNFYSSYTCRSLEEFHNAKKGPNNMVIFGKKMPIKKITRYEIVLNDMEFKVETNPSIIKDLYGAWKNLYKINDGDKTLECILSCFLDENDEIYKNPKNVPFSIYGYNSPFKKNRLIISKVKYN